MSRFAARYCLSTVVAGLTVASTTCAQSTRTWTGLAAPDANWSTDTNWDVVHPISGDTALFNGAGNGNTIISLGGATQPIKTIQFDTSSTAAYTLGALASGDKFNMDSGGAITLTATNASSQVINADIQANSTLTINNSSTTGRLSLNGILSGSAVTLSLGGASGGITQLNGQNTYSGTTNINVAGNTIQIGSSSNSGTLTSGPFGTSTIATTSGTNSPMQAINANQTIANPVALSFGFTVSNAVTPFNLTFTGPFTYPSTNTGGRTLTFNTPGQTTTLGSTSSPSTITLSSTASVPLIMDTSQNSTLVINDVIQDNGATAGLISYNSIGNNTPEGTMLINSANTYSGTTAFGNQTSGTFNALSVEINVNSVGSPGSITSGPFGKGSMTFSNTNAPVVLQPFGADRTVANALTLNAGFFAANPSATLDPSGAHSLTLSGAITMGATGRTVTNNLQAGATLSLGSAATPSTMSLGNVLGFQTQAASGLGGGVTVINDAVSGAGGLTVQNNATLTLNNANTYSGKTTVQGTGTPTLLVNNASGSGTGTGFVTVTTGVLGGTGSIVPAGVTGGSNPAFQVTVAATGTIAPGSGGIGTLTFNSSSPNGPLMSFTAGATISDELNNSFQSDKIAITNAVAGDVTFNGNTINFTDLSGGALATGAYTLITSDGAGAFSGLTTDGSGNITSGLTIGTGLSAYSASSLQLVGNNVVLNLTGVAPPGVPGDYNGNGVVDAADYVLWRAGGPLQNEVASLGVVDQADYDAWRARFGNTSGAGSGSSLKGAGVPEPSTLLIVILGLAALPAFRGRRELAQYANDR